MVTLEFSLAVAVYILLTTITLFMYWIFFEKARASKGYSSADRYVWQCSICTYFYVDSKNMMLSVCPRCGSYNERQTLSSPR